MATVAPSGAGPPPPPGGPTGGGNAPIDAPDVPPATRVCTRCNQEKSLQHFVHLKDATKLTARCLACRNRTNAPARAFNQSIRALSSAHKRTVSDVQSPERMTSSSRRPEMETPEPFAGPSRRPTVLSPLPTLAARPKSPFQPVEPRRQSTGRRMLSNFIEQTASGLEFLRRGKRSQDTEEESAARSERAEIQRRHRSERRAGEEPSPTPTMSQLLEQQQPQGPAIEQNTPALSASGFNPQFSQAGSGGRSNTASGSGHRGHDEEEYSFVCDDCGIRRPTRCRHAGTNVCRYCAEPGVRPVDRHEQTCESCLRVFHSHEFIGPDGEYRIHCRTCSIEYNQEDRLSSPFIPSQRGSDHTGSVSSPGRPLDIRPHRQRNIQPSVSPHINAPVPDPPFVNDDLGAPCLSDQDQQLIANWQADMDHHTMEYCPRCRTRWFNQRMQNGICHSCHHRDVIPRGHASRNQRHEEGEPYFWSRDNNLDPGEIPVDLPELTQVEEMLISRVHVHVQVMTYRGQQYKYKGHVVNFLKDVGQVYRQLPLLPRELDIIVLRPRNQTAQAHMIRQFRGQFRVRQGHIRQWLEFLRANHPGYREIVIDEEHLSQLPEDGDVSDQLITELIDPVEIEEFLQDDMDEASGDPNLWEAAAVPNFIAQERDLTYLRTRLQGGRQTDDFPVEAAPGHEPQLEMPHIRNTPLNEFNRSQALLSLAFPTLYPTGEGDFVEPRQRSVTYSDYIERLMKFHDGRFAKHPRFPYVAFNTLMRQQVNQRSSFYVKKDGTRAEIDIPQLRAAFDSDTPEAKALLNSVVRYSGSLRGTRPFWGGRRHQLEAYVHGLGCPGIFLTFSAADLHWESLHRHMPEYTNWQNANNRGKMAIARKNLKENPHIAAYHFNARFTSFLENVIKPKFNVTESWFRYEWQARGSTHAHGLFWVKNAPTLDTQPGQDLQNINEDFLRFWGAHITAINPDRQQPGQQRDINLLISIIPNPTFGDLAAVVNRVQRHQCTGTYCQRRKRMQNGTLSEETYCRFYFPRALHPEPVLARNMNPNYPIYDGPRNDTQLNNFNRTQAAVINYVVKYVGKAEVKSESYKDIAKAILPRVNSSRGVVGFVAKFMNRLIAERDWSAQEVQHLLLNLELTHGTRVVQTVDCRHPKDHWKADFVATEGEQAVRSAKNTYQKYLDRPEHLQDLSYFQFLTKVDFSKGKQQWRIFPNAPDRILNYFPRYTNYDEDFARVKLMMHHPHVNFDELLTVEDTMFDTYQEAYQHCRLVHHGAHPDDYLSTPQLTLEEEEFEDDPDEEDEIPEQTWEELARAFPQDEPDTEEVDLLGNRPIDHAFDWDDYIGKHPQLCIQKREYWKNLRDNYSQQVDVNFDEGEVASLNPEQRLVYNQFVNHLDNTINPNSIHPAPLLLQVDGQGGTGKSYLIHVLSSALNSRKPGCVVRAAPTGIAANAINGATLHSMLHLPVSKQISTLSSLSGNELISLQASLRDVTYIIIDEKSMVGLKTFHFIDQRLRQVFPEHQHEYFGGRSVLLLGDFYQLPPVFEKPLYTSGHIYDLMALAGRNAYHAFDKTVELKQIVRQQGDEQAPFRDALQGLRRGRPTVQHWRLLSSRVKSKLTEEEVATFDDALRIFPTNLQVREFNRSHMEQLNNAVIQIAATHSNQFGNDAESSVAGNLHKTLPICIGARVMLTENLWTAMGLVNGAVGIVEDLAWEDRPGGVNPRRIAPEVIMVRFEGYTGPPYFDDEGPDLPDMTKIIPIFRSTREYVVGNNLCTRKQFPLTISYAITIHKSQGTTLDKAVAHIAGKDFTPGLSYVAVSRVKTLQGIMFEEAFDLSDISTRTDVQGGPKEIDRQRRLPQTLHAS
ncbi:ATP-dependent DNA helicase PIF1 [Fusarium pseudoanthophilum]|uniref:ATP-dependent DNA helicase n=1 Tax=Fusarium pseudoanthophilum TaxID=48495 RepID=A0A8H5KS06_9HYPO|nr:ATP-dependent DNA helicase PIF1 [Fusarium pseudoanthophilum]